jgi:hypothetical protein
MDEKQRDIGLDLEGLGRQVAEKQAAKAEEDATNRDYERRFLEEQRILGRLARQEQRIRREIAEEDVRFWREKQGRETSREWDITRPDYKHVQPPVRVGDDDPWLSVSGGQKFEGEDLSSEARIKRQNEQRKRWYAQQCALNEHNRAVELAEQREWERRYAENDHVMQEVEAEQRAARKEIQRLQDDENYRAMMAKKAQDARDRADALAANEDEINVTCRGAFMSESPDQAVGVDGKMVTQDFKGYGSRFDDEVRAEQAAQRAATLRRRQAESEEEKREMARTKRETREALLRERAAVRARTMRNIELADEYKRTAEEHRLSESEKRGRLHEDYWPTGDFWKHFSISHR